ncbi:hypothetical protein [Actinomadura parmotrematis]|uniref:Uncharacterized protein n=1 Tax=Actinomadura parmotrematis TaxID=2864039 RepID=A0ABS7FL27_9ACTN|nr:hypothetical protein [Actinomadura parmotrematis]MBW8481063.1 hypothetical protein [Actinomadura parmotrematis]
MGTDIHGVLECRRPYGAEPRPWLPAIDLGLLYGDRDYDAFGCLFGVRNYASFRPLAAYRGLPGDVSDAVREAAADEDAHGRTWISWAEVAAVDWDEPAEEADLRLHQYRPGPDGALAYQGKSLWSAGLAEAAGVSLRDVHGGVAWEEGREYTDGTTVFRAERMLRRHAVPPDGAWRAVWTVLEVLAGRGGSPDDARLVVWFDS